MDGYIHSIESFGTVDGPGIRLVVFCQGCPMRCLYCHNPDTWKAGEGMRMSPQEIIALYEKNRPFYQSGGITATGGEPLLQLDFLLELFALAHERGIHTCLDTSAATYRESLPEGTRRRLDALLAHTDLVLLDIKHIDASAHRHLTGHGNEGVLAFARYLDRRGIPVWIRHVLVPGVTDDEEALSALGRFLGGLSNVSALDVLPYHTMGVEKYRALGMPYPLEGVQAATAEQAAHARTVILRACRQTREAGRKEGDTKCSKIIHRKNTSIG